MSTEVATMKHCSAMEGCKSDALFGLTCLLTPGALAVPHFETV